MDYIREFDIRLEKEMYYAGETIYGVVILDTSENFKLRGWYNIVLFAYSFALDVTSNVPFWGGAKVPPA